MPRNTHHTMHLSAALRVVTMMLFVAASWALPSTASAQGRCRCNSGCHQYPGQCVQSGSEGCESGYAPFCGTRAGDCPRVGFVSCNGECTCVRVGPGDAGAADVPASVDAPVSVDRPATPDAAMPADLPATFDAPVSVDRPTPVDTPSASDAVTSVDRPVVIVDAPVVLPDGAVVQADVPASFPDAPVVLPDGAVVQADVPACVCPGGECVGGRCIAERCDFQMELGFICTTPGTSCRLIHDVPYCVPLCLGLTCTIGEFCDDESNGECTVDRCASMTCPAGLTCHHNQCRRMLADGGYAPFGDDGGTPGGNNAGVDDGSCGCRVVGADSSRARWMWAGLAALAASRRRRARVSARSA